MSANAPADPMVEFMIEKNPQNLLEMRALTDPLLMQSNNNLPEIGNSIDDVVIANVDGSDITVDVHVPKGEGPFPVVLFIHGGGWSGGSSKTHRKLGFRIAEAGLLVFNLNYRRTPEFPFPAAFEDCKLALDWVRNNAQEYGGDLDRLAVVGDSAGGNMTAAVAAQDENTTHPIKTIGLIYPALELESWPVMAAAVPEGMPNLMKMMFEGVIPEEYRDSLSDPRISPLHVAEKYPPTFMTCGSMDASVLAGCEALPAKLEQAGITHEAVFYEGMPHGFMQMEEIYPEALQALRKMTDFLLANI